VFEKVIRNDSGSLEVNTKPNKSLAMIPKLMDMPMNSAYTQRNARD